MKSKRKVRGGEPVARKASNGSSDAKAAADSVKPARRGRAIQTSTEVPLVTLTLSFCTREGDSCLLREERKLHGNWYGYAHPARVVELAATREEAEGYAAGMFQAGVVVDPVAWAANSWRRQGSRSRSVRDLETYDLLEAVRVANSRPLDHPKAPDAFRKLVLAARAYLDLDPLRELDAIVPVDRKAGDKTPERQRADNRLLWYVQTAVRKLEFWLTQREKQNVLLAEKGQPVPTIQATAADHERIGQGLAGEILQQAAWLYRAHVRADAVEKVTKALVKGSERRAAVAVLVGLGVAPKQADNRIESAQNAGSPAHLAPGRAVPESETET